MGSCFSQDRVEPVSWDEMNSSGDPFKSKADEFDGPIKKRSCTDTFFLVLFIAFIVGLFALAGYCFVNGDVFRIINGYDNCGNICGRKNTPLEHKDLQCYGKDMTDKKFVQISSATKAVFDPKHTIRKCVTDCNTDPGFDKVLNRCIPSGNSSRKGVKEFFNEVSEDLHLCWKEILYLCLLAFALSIVLLFLFRFMAGFVVWFVLAAAVVTSICATIYLWIMWKEKHSLVYGGNELRSEEVEQRKESSYFVYAIISTIITTIILLIVWVMRKRIQLVVELFHQAGKAVSSMPMLLTTPVMTFCGLAVVVVMCLLFELWIESSGFLWKVPDSDNKLYYKKDSAMKTARVYNLLAMLWFTQFCIGCQQMVIAGAVATWFFTRNKSQLKSPIGTSFGNLVMYHLGTVALGSLLIALVQLIRIILKAIQSQLKDSKNEMALCVLKACQCCLYCFEKFLAYLTRNAFIEVAIYGENFCRSGQQAFKVLSNNALRVATINSIGDFVLLLGKAFVVFITVIIGSKFFEHKEGLQHIWVPLSLVALFAALVSHCFITVYEMVIDTIFICFCEDCELNDGISKPYFMSKDLMAYVENSKKVLAVGDGQ